MDLDTVLQLAGVTFLRSVLMAELFGPDNAQKGEWTVAVTGRLGTGDGLRRQSILYRPQYQANQLDRPKGQVTFLRYSAKLHTSELMNTVCKHTGKDNTMHNKRMRKWSKSFLYAATGASCRQRAKVEQG